MKLNGGYGEDRCGDIVLLIAIPQLIKSNKPKTGKLLKIDQTKVRSVRV